MLTVDVISTIELSPHVSSLSKILERDITLALGTTQIQRQIFLKMWFDISTFNTKPLTPK